MRTYNFTYTRCTPQGRILEHIVDTLSAYTAKNAKHILVKRFGLQNWTPWRRTETGGFIKTRNTHAYRGKIIVE